eukprot:CAMPEP_0175067364 /NCGR_PEP_ID=MMETSP0052_2-20121109/17057_1 /TAXON_ID=51329 ORGANISM="Polytomella parva, Strain SAG 63-3" /NCGR_SAMPLE_ID=MMETSP0052_2 /ASSEMBLY_ACC=CAM_ASM_000194 /LENGTH=160 /DNA_ID=CAMNT_0016334237 /DNA_START=184 /DNA_END=663 /DNA_ORIENTATION=+
MDVYRGNVRPAIKRALAELESDWGAAIRIEWCIVFVHPFQLDPNDRDARRVFEKLREDYSPTIGRHRIVRLDLVSAPSKPNPSSWFHQQPFVVVGTGKGAGRVSLALSHSTAAALAHALRTCLLESFRHRRTAYDNEVKRLSRNRAAPDWSFASLYLIRD